MFASAPIGYAPACRQGLPSDGRKVFDRARRGAKRNFLDRAKHLNLRFPESRATLKYVAKKREQTFGDFRF